MKFTKTNKPTESKTNKEKSTDFMNGAQALFKARTDAWFDTGFANPGKSEIQLGRKVR
jgi:hypothetical protein